MSWPKENKGQKDEEKHFREWKTENPMKQAYAVQDSGNKRLCRVNSKLQITVGCAQVSGPTKLVCSRRTKPTATCDLHLQRREVLYSKVR